MRNSVVGKGREKNGDDTNFYYSPLLPLRPCAACSSNSTKGTPQEKRRSCAKCSPKRKRLCTNQCDSLTYNKQHDCIPPPSAQDQGQDPIQTVETRFHPRCSERCGNVFVYRAAHSELFLNLSEVRSYALEEPLQCLTIQGCLSTSSRGILFSGSKTRSCRRIRINTHTLFLSLSLSTLGRWMDGIDLRAL